MNLDIPVNVTNLEARVVGYGSLISGVLSGNYKALPPWIAGALTLGGLIVAGVAHAISAYKNVNAPAAPAPTPPSALASPAAPVKAL